eukprot:TRINITY_DN10951_c0_g1_i1.p1 TRINITY_DN10951_c0_g1~~TRINITY_DN10951_c0_g1_i1.p1  ORF type:complete len:1264 (+),score=461.24 TRINITY_DN10951_c0_g1_i1:38-3829(+)
MEDPLLQKEEPTPEEAAGFWSRLTFTFVTPVLIRGYEEPLQAHHLPRIHRRFAAGNVFKRWSRIWDEEKMKARPSLVRALIKCYIWRFQFSVAMELIELIFNFFGPILMQSMITYTSQAHREISEGLTYVTIMFISSLFRALSATQTGSVLAGIGMDVQTAMVSSIYNKSVRSSSRGKYTRGEIINIQSNDALRIANTAMSLNSIWSTPANLIIAVVLLLRTIGPAAFAGMAVLLGSIPFNTLVYWALASIRIELLSLTDRRVTLMNEMLQGIRVVKFTCLEEHFKNRILDVRRQELILLKKQAYWHSMASVVLFIIPILVSVSTFVTYASMGYILTPAIIFTSVALFNNLRGPLSFLPVLIASFAEAKASIRRLEKYLLLPEIITDKELKDPSKANLVVYLKKASFRWEEEGEVVLHEIDMEVKRGELVMVIGKVGSGKSSLACAILGEVEKVTGTLHTTGTMGYCQQQAWIVNATVRENILFGSTFFEQEYKNTLHVCALERDMTLLAAGDQTELGEQGINLSGGQKQRISLARAVYHNADIVVLDDVLSAVDPQVGKHIFDKCLSGTLAGKTRILITHQLQYLPQADQIIVLDEGRIVFSGSYREIVDSAINISEFIKDANLEGEEEEASPDQAPTQQPTIETDDIVETSAQQYQAQDGKLMSEEDRATGAVGIETIWWYTKACGPVLLFFFLFLVFSEFCRISTDLWLSYWSDQKFWPDPGVSLYLGVYILLGFVSSLFSLLKGLALVESAFYSSVRLHNQMLGNVLRAQTMFYDQTPAGRVLNRFSRDLDTLDAGIADMLAGIVSLIFVSISTVTVISGVMPILITFFIPLSSVYFVMMQYYRATSRELNRVVAISASPIYSHFAESLSGVITIRSYNLVEKFIAENEEYLDNFHGPYWAALNVGRWLSIRLEFIGGAVLFMTSVMVVLNTQLPPGLVGLTLSYSMQITMVLEMAVTSISGLESEMNSVQRIQSYCKDIPIEAPLIVPGSRPGFNWLRESAGVEVHNLHLRYRPNLPDVLRGINFIVKDGEKVGIVGRTGSGKSSLMLGLLRILEANEGRIIIDNIDISTVGLLDLRSRVSIIPQDPVLFSGTVKSNLDPDAAHPDKAIWNALEQAHLREVFEQTDDKLDVAVIEGGQNFSVGQRQLVCLARALLRESKLLLMDEVTASVDVETDALIQQTVAEAFRDCTVLTIAHRLDTIMNYDKVMVLGDGHVLEYDSPLNLLNNTNGNFYSMVMDAGETRARQLMEIARRGKAKL